MKILLTLDFWDGTLSKSKTMYSEDLNSSLISFELMRKGVAGITITNANSLKTIIKELNQVPENNT